MIEEIKNYRWSCFKGETHWVRCFAHILNLIAQVILRPFGSHKKKNNLTTTADQAVESNNEESEEEEEVEDRDDQIRL
jgi:CBS domain containing-hemolysin-like protein